MDRSPRSVDGSPNPVTASASFPRTGLLLQLAIRLEVARIWSIDSRSEGDSSASRPSAYTAPTRHLGRTDEVPAAEADDDGIRCPYSAHLRKINPRDQATDIGGPDNTLHRCILRRGIPFGLPYVDDTADADRGLLFASYQASITDQFEFLITDWVNSAKNPQSHPGGMDLLIGGEPLAARTLVIRNSNGAPYTVPVAGLADRPWVTATGGGYFFAPAVSTIAAAR